MFDEIEADIIDLSSLYDGVNFIIIGDFNARTGLFSDYVECDTDDHVQVGDNYCVDDDITKRANCDKETNHYGSKLLSLCKSAGLRIVNGRVDSDREGAFTCVTPNGTSTVDYMLVSHSMFNDVTDFRVGCMIESDHMPLELTLKALHKKALRKLTANVEV